MNIILFFFSNVSFSFFKIDQKHDLSIAYFTECNKLLMTNCDEQIVIRYRNVPDYESREYMFNLYCCPLYLYQMIIFQ